MIMPNYWLFKTEPESYSIDDLERDADQTTFWDGVRNYQARNMLRDEVRVGDLVLIYHSNAQPPAIVGVATVVRAGSPDLTAQDPHDHHFDPKASAQDPRWYGVDIKFVRRFERPLPLGELREIKSLQKMELLRKGSRLSIQPVRKAEYQKIMTLV